MMPMYLSPVSALHTGFPIVPQSGRTCPTPFDCYYPGSGVEYPHPRMNSYHRRPVYPSTHYHHIPVDVDAAVERAAYEYAISQRRSRAIEQERLRRILAIQEHRRQVEEQRRAKEARAQAQAQAHAQAQVVAMGIAVEQEARRQARSAQYTREYERAKAEEVARLQHALRRQQEAEIRKCEAAQKAFLDAVRARSNEPEQLPHIHVRPQAASGQRVETPQETLRRRLEVDEDVEVQGIIANLLKLVAASSATSDNHEDKTKDTPAAQDKGKARESPDISFPWERASERQAELDKVGETIRVVHFDKPVVSPAAPSTRTTPVPTQSEAEGADLHRKPAIRRSTDTQLSLGAIDRVGNLLQELKGSFVFPTDLDHPSSPSRSPSPSPVSDSDSAQLPFTSKNKPVHLYEHALNGLLARLDEVDSYGDEEVRRRRKEVVLEIEKALEDVARKVAEASPVLEEAILPEETEIPSVPVAAPVSEEEVATPEEAAVEPEVVEETLVAASVDDLTPSVSDTPDVEVPAIAEDIQVLGTAPDPLVAVVVDAVSDASDPEVVEPTLVPTVDPNSPTYEEVEVEEITTGGPSSILVAEVTSDSEIFVSDAIAAAEPEEPELSVEVVEDSSNAAQDLDIPAPIVEEVEEVVVDESADPTTTDPLDVSSTIIPATVSLVQPTKDEQPIVINEAVSAAPSDAESTFLLQSHHLEEDPSYLRAKARAAASKDEGEVDWEEAGLSASDVDMV